MKYETNFVKSMKFDVKYFRIRYIYVYTCSEVDNNITKKNCVGNDIENDTSEGEVIIKEGDSNRKDDEVGDEKK